MRYDLKIKFKALLKELEGVIIEKSTSPNYCNAYLLSKKLPNGKTKDRLIVNLKKLNERTIKLFYKLITLEDVFSRLYGAVLYTSIDCCKAFYHLYIEEKDRDNFSFITPFGLYW